MIVKHHVYIIIDIENALSCAVVACTSAMGTVRA